MAEELLEGTVTVLFTDVQNSTELRTSRGDDAAHRILRAQEDVVRQQIEAHSGREVKALGDGFMVAFGSARRAVQCAVGIQRAIHDYNHGNPEEQVQVRIGLNSGEVNQEDGDLFGAAVNAASRVAAKAKGGEVLVAGVVKQLAGKVPEVNFVDRGRFRLKGFDERWQLFQVAWEDEHDHHALSPAAAVSERTPLVARDSERDELFGALDAAMRGQSSIVLIGGEPGVGKTRLASEAVDEAERRGFRTFVGRCYESEGTPPYQPFVEVVEMAASKLPPDVLRRDLGDAAGEVARLMPELRQRFDDIPEALELPPEQERRYLFNSIRDFLARAAGTQPICILFDDLHWADESSLLLLEHVAQHLGQMPVVILGTYRDVELDLGRPLARTLDSLHRQRLTSRVSLKRLDQSGVKAMLEVLGGADPPETLVGVINEETDGNPFFVEEVFKHLLEGGQLLDAAGGWRSDLEVGELDVPESVRLVVGRRLERLGDGTRQALAAAAVIGRGFTFSLLSAMGGDLTEDALFEALDEAERAQLLTSSAAGREVTFTFAHELIRQTLLGNLSTLRRQRLHMQVAEAMEQVYGDGIEAFATEMSHHLAEAGAAADRQKVALYFTIAAERAMEAAAFTDALRVFGNALDVVEADDPTARARILAGLGAAYRTQGRWDDSRAAWSEAIDIYEGAGETEKAALICWEMALAYAWGFRWEDSLLAAGRGLNLLGEARSAIRAGLLGLSGLIVSLAGNYDAGETMTTEALRLAEDLAEANAQETALGVRAIHHWAYLQPRPAVELGTRAMDMARQTGRLWGLVDTGTFIAFAVVMLGRQDEVDHLLDEIEEVAARIGHVQAQNLSRRVRFFSRYPLDADGLRAFGDDDLERVRDLEGDWLKDAYADQGWGSFWQGDWDAAEERYRLAVDEVARGQPWIWNAVYPGLVLHVLGYQGRRDEALQLLNMHRGDLPQAGKPSPLGAWGLVLYAVEALAMLGERDEAYRLYPLLQEALESGAETVYDRSVSMAAGISAAAGRDWDHAEEHFTAALEWLKPDGKMTGAIDARRFYGAMLIDRNGLGDLQRARGLLDEALGIAEQAGAARHAELIRAQLGAASS